MAQATVPDRCASCGEILQNGEMAFAILRVKLTTDPKYQPYGDKIVPDGRIRLLLQHSNSNMAVCESCWVKLYEVLEQMSTEVRES